MYTMSSQLNAIQQQLSSAQMNATMLNSLKGVNDVMGRVNAEMNPQAMQQIMKEFAKETAKMDMQGEMMNDAMEAAGDANTETDAEEVYNQILGEIGMDAGGAMATGSGAISTGPVMAAEAVSLIF